MIKEIPGKKTQAPETGDKKDDKPKPESESASKKVKSNDLAKLAKPVVVKKSQAKQAAPAKSHPAHEAAKAEMKKMVDSKVPNMA